MKKKLNFFYAISLGVVLWIILRTSLPAYAANPENYISNASGGLRIGVVQGDKPLTLVNHPDLIKTIFDLGWIRVRDEFNNHIVHFINHVGDQNTIEVVSNLATIDQAELRVVKLDNGALLKYILHHNTMYLTFNISQSSRLSYMISFDIEMGLAIQASKQGQRLRLADAAISIQNIKIKGMDWISELMVPLIEASFQSVQEQAKTTNNPLSPLMREVTKQFTPFVMKVLGQIPSSAIYTDIDVSPINGMITFCFKSSTKAVCKFPRVK